MMISDKYSRIQFDEKYTIIKTLIRSSMVVIIVFSMWLDHLPVQAQELTQWSPQQRIPSFDDFLHINTPVLIADQNHTIHAFSSQWVGDLDPQLAIVYNWWTPDRSWSLPVDIILSPMEQARVMGAFLDQTGTIHLTFFGGDDTYGNIYYTRAPISRAGEATAWSTPKPIGDNAITPSVAAMTGDSNGNLLVVYSGNRETTGLYAIYSSDTGYTWSQEEPIYLTYNEDLFPFRIQLAIGQEDHVHAVWVINNQRGNSEGGYYANLDLQQRQWSTPMKIDEGLGTIGVSIPAVAEYKDNVFIIYNNGLPPNGSPVVHWMRRSDDGGQTWTDPVRPFPNHRGANGIMSFVVDSNDDLHILFGQRIAVEGGAIHGAWHSTWLGNQWSEPEAIVSGPQVREPSDRGFDPYDVRAVISQGNTLLAAWRTDPGIGANGIWYSYKILDAPSLPEVAIPTPEATFAPTPTTMQNVVPTESTPLPTPKAVFATSNNNTTTSSPMRLLVIGISPVVLLIVIIIFFRFRHIFIRLNIR